MIGPVSDLFGDDKSVIGTMRRQLLAEQMKPGGKYNKEQIAVALQTIEVLLDLFRRVADINS